MSAILSKAIRYERAKRQSDLTQPCIDVLLALRQESELSMERISDAASIIVPTLRRHVADLRKAGYIIRRTDQQDLKKVTFVLSPKGSKLIESILASLK